MRIIILISSVLACDPALAGGFNARDAGACYFYADATNKQDVLSMTKKLITAYQAEREATVHAQAFAATAQRDMDADPYRGAARFSVEGAAACHAIGVM